MQNATASQVQEKKFLNQCSYQTAALRHCRTRISPRGPKGAKKKEKKCLNICNILRTFLLNINQNFISYGVLIQTLNIYYLRKYEVFTRTQSCEYGNCI